MLNAGSVRPSRTRDWPGATRRRGREGTRDSTLDKPATRPHASRRNHKRAYAIARYTSAHTLIIRYAWWVVERITLGPATLGHGSSPFEPQ